MAGRQRRHQQMSGGGGDGRTAAAAAAYEHRWQQDSGDGRRGAGDRSAASAAKGGRGDLLKMDDDQSDISDKEIEAAAQTVVAVAYATIQYCRRHLMFAKEPVANKESYLDKLLFSDDVTSISMVGMKRGPFFRLCGIMRQRALLQDTLNVTVEEQLAMFLHAIGHNVRNREVRQHFMRSGETVSRYFNHVLYAIGELREDFIRPSRITVHDCIASNSELMPFFKDCIGAIGSMHVHANVPSNEAMAFQGKEPYPTQIVLAAVDFDLHFTYVLAGWEGSAHDAVVLQDAIEKSNGLRIPEGKYYLVDASFSTGPGHIAPYHLAEWDSHTASTAQELFNLRHSSLRKCVERAFGSLKNRFKILSSRPFFPFPTQVDLVLACCILHNYIMSCGGDNLVPIEEVRVTQPTQYRIRSKEGDDNDEYAQIRDCITADMWKSRNIN